VTDRLSPLDASFLEIEEQDEASHMHIGCAMVFEPLPEGGAPTVDRVRAQLEPRLGALPRFGARLSAPRTGGLSWPRWVPDERFDVADHVRRAVLPAPGGEPQLLEWLADFWSHRLDRSRPLWELVLPGRLTCAVAELIVRDELIGAPHTSLNVPIGGSRSFAVARTDLAGLKAIAEFGALVHTPRAHPPPVVRRSR
jgi:hypothetical protein